MLYRAQCNGRVQLDEQAFYFKIFSVYLSFDVSETWLLAEYVFRLKLLESHVTKLCNVRQCSDNYLHIC